MTSLSAANFYEKIGQSSTAWDLDQKTSNALFNQQQWVVTEKIHGSNLCWVVQLETGEITAAKRRGEIPPGESFYGHDKLLPTIADKLRRVATHVRQLVSCDDAVAVHLYGEIFGGAYPHEDVPAVAGVQAVQTGIWYCADIQWYGFDIAIVDARGGKRYLAYDAMAAAFSQSGGLLYATALFRGKFTQCIDFKLGFDSHLPRRFGLPELPRGTNKAEGVVLRPATRELLVQAKKGLQRPLIKRKIEEFSEKQYSKASKWHGANDGDDDDGDDDGAGKGTASSSAEGYANLDLVRYELLACVTPQRLDNAVSKIGAATRDNVRQGYAKQLLQELHGDVIDSMSDDADNEAAWLSLTDAERRTLSDLVETECRKLIVRHLKKLGLV